MPLRRGSSTTVIYFSSVLYALFNLTRLLICALLEYLLTRSDKFMRGSLDLTGIVKIRMAKNHHQKVCRYSDWQRENVVCISFRWDAREHLVDG